MLKHIPHGLKQVVETFGQPDVVRDSYTSTVTLGTTWLNENMKTIKVPIIGSIYCHNLAADHFEHVFNAILTRGLSGLIDFSQYGGCYSPRFKRGSNTHLSLHTWGIAIDLNIKDFPLGSIKQQDRRLVDVFREFGFFWGGDFQGRRDPMHFQLESGGY